MACSTIRSTLSHFRFSHLRRPRGTVAARDASTPFPATMDVDYLRVWQR
jgi:hypothetical protein